MPKTETTKNHAEAREALAQLRDLEGKLAREAAELPGKINAAVKEGAAQRARAARAGDSTAHVAADVDLDALRARQHEITFEVWAARIAATEAELEYLRLDDLKNAEIDQDNQRKLREVEARFLPVKGEYDQARAAAHFDRLGINSNARREARERLQRLEASYPGAEVAARG